MPMDFCGHIRQLDDDDILDVLFEQDISLQAELLDKTRSNLIAF